jgi:hypothetical protein
VKTPVQAPLDLSRKVNHHVAAEDQVKSALKAVRQKIVIAKSDLAPQPFDDIITVVIADSKVALE